ncbi:MAG: DUF302 domain-containing protein [bacterium]|nr:DUF302 domain-containing protein [bacterium]
MNYYISKKVGLNYEDAVVAARKALADEDFGVITEIDVTATLKKKIDVDFRDYIILGACHPRHAHEALLAEDKIGVMLPCNVVVQELDDGTVEVAAMDPAMMTELGNEALSEVAETVREKLKKVVEAI